MNQEVEEHVRSPSGAGELKGWEGRGRSEAGGGRAEAERESRWLRTTRPWGPSCDVGVYPEVKGE